MRDGDNKMHVGRPKVNPNYDPIKARDELSNAVADLYLHPSAEMKVDKDGHATMKSLELYFGLTMTKIRKLLVSAGVYHFYKDGVDMVEAVNELYKKGYTLEMIKDTLHISIGTANSLLPYKLGTYNADFTVDDYDYSNVSTDARRKRNQRKRERMKKPEFIDNRNREVKDLEKFMEEKNKTFRDRFNDKEREELKKSRQEAKDWLAERGIYDSEDIYSKVAAGFESGVFKLSDVPNYKNILDEEEIKKMESDNLKTIRFLVSYVLNKLRFIEEDEEIEGPKVKTIGKKFVSSRHVHGKPVGTYLFKPKKGEYYRESLDYCEEIIDSNEDMYGAIDENRDTHMFIIRYVELGSAINVTMSEVYKCNKMGQLYAKHSNTEYEFVTFGSIERKDKLVKEVIEKTVVALQNLTITRRKDIGFNPDCHLVDDEYYYSANEVGTIRICENRHDGVYFQIDGKKYEPNDVMKLFAPYCGFNICYQIGDKTNDVLESDMTLMPMRIDEDTLGVELHDLLFALSDDHDCTFISYENVAAFDVLFQKIIDKLEFYHRANQRTFGEAAANKLISILKEVGTDDDMFPEFEIKMVRDAVKELWEI